jgi:hypothetical protein
MNGSRGTPGDSSLVRLGLETYGRLAAMWPRLSCRRTKLR